MDIHSCSYYCDRPECVREQRDELVRRYVEPATGDRAEVIVALERLMQRAVSIWQETDNGIHSMATYNQLNKEAIAETIAMLRAGAVPDGWKLMPQFATDEMLRAGRERHGSSLREQYIGMWQAAPTPGQEKGK